MFSYAVSALSSRTDHPIVFSMFIVSLIFLGAGFAVDFYTGNGVASGFLAIYSGLFALFGVAGYFALYTAKAVSMVRDEASPTA